MADRTNSNPPSAKPQGRDPQTAALRCPEAEPLFAGYLDGTLDIATLTLLEAHLAECPECAAELKLVRQGKDWLAMLRADDAAANAPMGLAEKILARTGGPALPVGGMQLPAAGQTIAATPAAPWRGVNMAAVRRTGLLDPRLAMTAAMAFFSITLTLSVAGIRLNDLRPSNLRHTVTRTYSDTNAHVQRYYENMRVVYQLESRVRELRRAAEANDARRPAKTTTSQPKQQTTPQTTPQSNTSRPVSPMNDGVAHKGGKSRKSDPDPEPVVAGQMIEAALRRDSFSNHGNTLGRPALLHADQAWPMAAPHQMHPQMFQRSEA